MKKSIVVFCTGLLFVGITSVYAAKPKTEQQWDQCAEHAPGTRAGEHRDAIVTKCGTRPLLKTKSGNALLKKDCDFLYTDALTGCRDDIPAEQCGEGIDMLAMAITRAFPLYSEKVFSVEQFNALCKQTCTSKKMPDRSTFGTMICGEPKNR